MPMRPGQIERRTHDYTCHGNSSVLDALDKATGKVIGRCYPRHRGRSFLTSAEIEHNVPPDLDVHLVMDNYATHKTRAIRKWLVRGRDGMFISPRPSVHGSIWSEHFFAEDH